MSISSKLAIVVVPAILLVAACGQTQDQRVLSGGALGAVGGAVVAPALGASPLTGAVVGGLGGAAVGALSTPPRGYAANRGYYR